MVEFFPHSPHTTRPLRLETRQSFASCVRGRYKINNHQIARKQVPKILILSSNADNCLVFLIPKPNSEQIHHIKAFDCQSILL